MIRSVAALFALLLIGFVASEAAPVRQPRGPLPSEAEPLDFRGTHWFGKSYEGTDWTIIFEPNGGITNIDSGRVHKLGSWKSIGPNTVYMELNNVYYEFRGTVAGDVLDGDSSNKVGLRWKSTFRRIAQTQ